MRSTSRHWLQGLGLEFWLPLPVLASLFWLSCNLISTQVLSRPHDAKEKLQADTQLEIQISVNVSMITAVIDRLESRTQVEVQTTESNLRKLEFTFPVTDTNQVEMMIAQELGISRQNVRKLVRYRIVD
jgi:DNA-binding MarR family transcriptional regulator